MRRITLAWLGQRVAALPEPYISSWRFDLTAAVLNVWLVAGMYLDGWAHVHEPGLETFFTPWHGVLYAGFFASGLLLLFTWSHNAVRGYPLRRSLPAGYGLSLIGAGLFLAGGLGDMLWHTLFGIEAGVEALLSPTHLLLALAGSLLTTGPLRAAGHRALAQVRPGTAKTGYATLPVLLSLAFLLSALTFFTEYASPWAQTLAAVRDGAGTSAFRTQGLAIASILLQSALLMGIVLFALRHLRLPFSSLTLILVLNTTLVTFMHEGLQATGPWPLIAAAGLAGLAGDALMLWLRPSAVRATAFRVYAFTVPALLYAFYFAALQLFGGGLAWSIHMWSGAIVLAGATGWLLSYIYLPPTSFEE